MKLPSSMDPHKYGEVFLTNTQENKHSYAISNGNYSIHIEQEGLTSKVHYKAPIDLKFTDTEINESLFKREIMKDTLYIYDGEVVVKSKQLNAKPFTPINLDKQISEQDCFMTIDIETVLVENKQTPYLICGYTPEGYIESHTNDLSQLSQDQMFKEFISKILENKTITTVYAHNFSSTLR